MDLEKCEHINNGIAYMSAKNYADAAEEFRTAARLDPKATETYLHLGNACVNLNQLDQALKAFKTALMLEPDNGKILFSLGGVCLLNGQVAEAIRYYNRAEAAGYRTVELYTICAGIFTDEQDYAMAVRFMGKAINLQPLNASLYSRKAMLEIAAGMPEQALETAGEFRSLIPDALDSYDLSVKIYCMQGQFSLAEQASEEGLSRFPDDPAMRLLKLKVLIESAQFGRAEEYAREMLKLKLTDSLYKQTVLYLSAAYARLGKNEDAIAVLEDYVREHKDPEVMYLLMNSCLMLRKYADVKRFSEGILSCDAGEELTASAKFYHADAIKNLVGAEAAEKEYRELVSELRRLSLKHPEMSEIYIFRLISHVELGEYEKALELAEYLEKAYPERADGHMYKSYIYKKTGNTAMAKKEKELALQINPDLKLL